MQTTLGKIAKLKSGLIDEHVEAMLNGIVGGKQVLELKKDAPIFCQGDHANSIFYILMGQVKITVISFNGKRAVLSLAGPREFFGEGCMVGQSVRLSTATATESTTVFSIQKRAMMHALYAQRELSEHFTAALLARNIELEEKFCDQVFNDSERRLARILLKLARLGRHTDIPNAKVPRLTHETLAEMVGTTRSRISFFMNKFRRLRLIEYTQNSDITVREELLTDVVLHDRD